jgi:transglutaminase-like putative cysteine protease
MSFEKSFQFSSCLLSLMGLVAVAAAGGVGTTTVVLYLVMLSMAWLVGPRRLSKMHQALTLAAVFAVFLLDFFVFGDFGSSTIRFLLLLSLFKTLVREKGADYLVLYLISFALLLLASTYTVSILYLVTLVVFLFLSVLVLILFENRGSFRARMGLQFSFSAHIQIATVISALTILIAIPIFFAIPRGALGFLGRAGANVSGFSSTVDLGDTGRIRQDSEVVMRVSVDRDPNSLPEDLRWRGLALNSFDGKVWTSTLHKSERLLPDLQGRYPVSSRRRQTESLLEQTFFVESFSDIVFGAQGMVQLFGFRNRNTALWRDGNQAVFIRPRQREALRYFVHSDLETRAQKSSRIVESPVPKEVESNFLELPQLDERIIQLSETISDGSGGAFGKALRLETFLREGFEYTLENPSGNVADPLADFLFRSRAGHCEYFAAAQAVMLRAVGIPSRVVNGFRRGELNEWSDYFIVRQSDAHSWVEAFFPGPGWIEFDPTPASGQALGSSWYRQLAQILDTLDVVWTEIVTFDRGKQIGFFQSVRRKIDSSWSNVSAVVDRLVGWDLARLRDGVYWLGGQKLALLKVLLLLLVSFLTYRYRRYLRMFWKRHVLNRSGKEIAQEYYLELLEVLARKGFKKSKFETPREFGVRVKAAIQSELPLQVTETYYRSRYGGHLVGQEELASVYSSLRELKSGRFS